MLSFIFGVGSIALLMGFLVGASSSPVAGVALTAGFGIVAAALTYLQTSAVGDPDVGPTGKPSKDAKTRAISIATLNSLGRVLFMFSVAFSLGLGAGIWARSSTSAVTQVTAFPWGNLTAPTSPRSAIDWLLVHRNLRLIGYSNAQIEAIYRLSLDMKKDEAISFRNQELLSPMFGVQKVDQSTQNILAHQPPPSPSLFNRPFEVPSSPLGPKGEIG